MSKPHLHATAALLWAWLALTPTPSLASSATDLLVKRSELQPQLLARSYGEPLYLTSREGVDQMAGDAYAELALPFAQLSGVLTSANSLCELLFLHLNVRSCQAAPGPDGAQLTLTLGPKKVSAASTLHSMVYSMHVDVATPSYLKVTMQAAQGPMATSNYRIVFELLPIDDGHSFLHFSYGYGYGAMAKLSMNVYMATVGRSKIGFTRLGRDAQGQVRYIGGARASLERNVMRNYLALLAYCSVTSGTPAQQTEARLRQWFKLTEQYAAQLHELDLDEYLLLKHADLVRVAALEK